MALTALLFFSSSSLSAQGISLGESLRDRSRVLRKTNPVSSETTGFSALVGPSARNDAEGIEPIGRFWSTRLSEGEETTLVLQSEYGDLAGEIDFGWRIERKGFFVNSADGVELSGYSIRIGESNTTQQFDSLEYAWVPLSDSLNEFSPSIIRADKRTIERKNRFSDVLIQWQTERLRLFASAGASIRNEDDARRRLEYQFVDNSSYTPGVFEFDGVRLDRSGYEASDTQKDKRIAIGGELEINDWLLESELSFREWSRDRPTTNTVRFQNRYSGTVTLDITDDEDPRIFPNNAGLPLDEFIFRDNRFLDNRTDDEDFSASLRAQRSGESLGFKYNFDIGIASRSKTRRNEDIKNFYTRFTGPAYTIDHVMESSPSGATLQGAIDLGFMPDLDATDRHFALNQDLYVLDEVSSIRDTFAARYDAEEAIDALYTQLALESGAWRLATGFRYEETTVNTFGYQTTEPEGGLPVETGVYHDSIYSDLFPTINANYKLNQNVSFGASWQSTVARPNYYELIPYRIVSDTIGLVRAGNPELEETVLDSTTLFVSANISSSSNLTLSLSHIKISDFILSVEELLTSGEYEGYRLRTTFNGDNAEIESLSVDWSSEWDAFNDKDKVIEFSANYQYRDSTAWSTFIGQDDMKLPEVAKHKLRSSLSQKVGKFDWLLQADYLSRSLDKFGSSVTTNEFLDDRFILSTRFGYRMQSGWQLQTEISNINDSPQNESFGPEERLSKVTYNSWHSKTSLSRSW